MILSQAFFVYINHIGNCIFMTIKLLQVTLNFDFRAELTLQTVLFRPAGGNLTLGHY